jgi:pimeloyl-ACP methyl ester carboxylesterase
MKTIFKKKTVLWCIGILLATLSVQFVSASPLGPGAVIDTTAVNSKIKYARVKGHRIAYRAIGNGKPIILASRFRGSLDYWDPAFLDELAKSYRVITFDYSGTGRSEGELPTDMVVVGEEIIEFARQLGYSKFIVGGWSYGGMVCQTLAVHHPEVLTHLLLMGTNPPGKSKLATSQLFLDTSSKWDNDLTDETILFFEPESPYSRNAAKLSHERLALRKTDRDLPVAKDVWPRYYQAVGAYYEDKDNVRQRLGKAPIPILMLAGDHDIANFPENWFDLNRTYPNLQLVVFPQTGHGPQHQYPLIAANYILTFLKYSEKP